MNCSKASDGFSYIDPHLHITSPPWACSGAAQNNGCFFHSSALQQFADSSFLCFVRRGGVGRWGSERPGGFKKDGIAFRWAWSWAVSAWEALSFIQSISLSTVSSCQELILSISCGVWGRPRRTESSYEALVSGGRNRKNFTGSRKPSCAVGSMSDGCYKSRGVRGLPLGLLIGFLTAR